MVTLLLAIAIAASDACSDTVQQQQLDAKNGVHRVHIPDVLACAPPLHLESAPVEPFTPSAARVRTEASPTQAVPIPAEAMTFWSAPTLVDAIKAAFR